MVAKYLDNIYSFYYVLDVQDYKLYDAVILCHYFMFRNDTVKSHSLTFKCLSCFAIRRNNCY